MRPPWLIIYSALLLALVGWLNLITADDHQFSRLAEAFLSGQLNLLPNASNTWNDTAPFNGKYYSALGPFPAIMISPAVAAGLYHQGVLAFLGTVGVFYLCARLAMRLDYAANDAWWWALAFCFGTSFVGVAALATSNHLSHVVAVLLLFGAIYEYQTGSRQWIIGTLVGLAMASRAPTALNILFFILVIGFGPDTRPAKVRNLACLLLSFGAVVAMLAGYNFARFGNPLENGYSFQLNGYGQPYATWDVPGNNPGPALSLAHVTDHLRVFFFGLPSFNGIGTSVLLVSPFLVYLWKDLSWDLTNRLIVVNVIPVLLLILAFRSTGFEQMGYRFSLDFLPFIFWLAMRSRIEMTGKLKALICLATLIDLGLTIFHMATGVARRMNDL